VEPGGTVDVRKGEGVMFVFSVSDIDFECEGDIIAWAIKDGPAHGEVRPGPWVPITQPDIVDVLYIAARDYCCQDSFTIECVDRGGKTGQATAWVNIVNNPPLFSGASSLEKSVHVPTGGSIVLNGELLVSDADGDKMNISISYRSPYALVSANLSEFASDRINLFYELQPAGYIKLVGACQGEDDLVDEFSVVASDGYGGEDVLVVTVIITPEDKAPVAHSQTVDYHGGTVPITLTGEDPDGDPIQFELLSDPSHGTLSGTPPNLTYSSTDPTFLKRGNEDSFSFAVTDTVLTSNPAAVTIVVVNQPPVAVDDSAETTEGVSVMIPVLANDSDPDGDPFTLVSVGPAGHGTTTISGNKISYAPKAGFCGEDSFTYTIADEYGGEATAAVTVVVKDVTPPTITVPPDMDLGCNPVDTSPEATGQATATDNCDPNPVITYTDEVSEEGCRVTITRTWKATDACGNGAQEVQTITYISDTVPPTIHCPGSFTRYVHEPAGTLVWVSFPVTVTDNCDPNPSLSCAPGGGWFEVGTTTQAYTSCTAADACDHTASQDCTFWVTVEFVNHDPVARDDHAQCSQSGYVYIPVLANDSDPDGDYLTIISCTQPHCGTADIVGDRILFTTAGCYLPGGTSVGLTYTITDGYGGYATARVTVTLPDEPYPNVVPPEES